MAMAKIESYEDLEVWQLAMTLAEQCYTLTKQFPGDELYGLTSQKYGELRYRSRPTLQKATVATRLATFCNSSELRKARRESSRPIFYWRLVCGSRLTIKSPPVE